MAMIHLEPQTLEMFSRALDGLKPPPNLSLSQWADKYRKLSAEASASQGQWNTDAAPFQREIMDAIGDVHVRKVVAMMCAQAGKTEGLILNTIGFYMSYHPASIMVMQPTVNLGESFSKDRLTPMLRDTPALRGLVNTKSRYSGNTISKKNFPGGMLVIVGANAPTDLRSRPIKVLLADEVDAYKASAGKEGDPVMLAEERQTTFWDYKTVMVSTPTTKSRQPHSGRVQQLHARSNGRCLVRTAAFISRLCGTTMVLRQRQVAGRRCAVPLHRVRLSGQRIPLEER